MQDSIITKYLGFKSWGGKVPAEQASWSVRDIPRLFKTRILDPSRATPTQATLDAGTSTSRWKTPTSPK